MKIQKSVKWALKLLSFYLSLLDTEEEKSKLEMLYYEYKALMKYIAFNILNNNESAEDAVHEAFIKLTRHLDGIKEIKGSKTKSFIAIVTRSVSLDILQKEKKISSFGNIEEARITDIDVFERIAVEELCSKIKSLPDIHKDILELKVYYDLSDKAIADILGISNQATRKRLQRARNALREILNEGGDL